MGSPVFLTRYAGLVVCALAAGCGACGTTAPSDAGQDAGFDAGFDAGRDGGARDAGRDAIVDAGFDADAGPDPEWTPLPEHETGCVIEYARNPQAVYTPSWVSCPAGMPAGCERLDMPQGVFLRANFRGPEIRIFVGLPGTTVDGRIVVLAGHDRALLATRALGPVSCTTGFENVGDGRAVFTTWTNTDASHYDERHYIVEETTNVWGPPVTRVNRPSASAAEQFEISSLTYLAVLADASKIEVYEDARASVLRGLGIPQATFLIGRDVFWEDWTSGSLVSVYHGTVDSPGAVFFATPDGSDLKGFATDGIDMVWNQSYGPTPTGTTYERTELWTAPYTNDRLALAPRLVTVLPRQPLVTVVGDGWYGFGTAGGTDLFRLNDGHHKHLAPLIDGWETQFTQCIAAGIVAFTTRRRAIGRFESTLFLIPIDAILDVP